MSRRSAGQARVLDDGFGLTHITAYAAEGRAARPSCAPGDFAHHGVNKRSAEVTEDRATPALPDRHRRDGLGHADGLRLQPAMDYARRDEGWRKLRSVVTTW